jgi:hypothetical protein
MTRQEAIEWEWDVAALHASAALECEDDLGFEDFYQRCMVLAVEHLIKVCELLEDDGSRPHAAGKEGERS